MSFKNMKHTFLFLTLLLMAHVPELTYSFTNLSNYNNTTLKLDINCELINRNSFEFIIKAGFDGKYDISDHNKETLTG